MSLTVELIGKMTAAVSNGTTDFEAWMKRHKIPEEDREEAQGYWDALTKGQAELKPGQTLAPPSEWS